MRYQKKCLSWQAEAGNLKGVKTRISKGNYTVSANNRQDNFDLIALALPALNSSRADDRESWLHVGMAVHAGTGGSEAGLSLWDNWSRQSEKYRHGECLRQWRSFKTNGKIGLGTLVHMAKQDSPDFSLCPGYSKTQRNEHLTRDLQVNKPPRKPCRFQTANEAIAMLEAQLGPISMSWQYLDAEWETCGYVLRWNMPHGKTYRPVSRGIDGLWYLGAMPKPRPIYNLPYIRESGHGEPVIVCEGEKDCEAFDSCGLLATTSSGGAEAANLTDWAPLAGREVIICPDNDPAGEKYGQTVCRILQQLTPSAKLRLISFYVDEIGPKSSAADWLIARIAAGQEVQ